jgi:hypothetical protein
LEKRSTKVTMIIITVLWISFLLGIISYQPYMEKYGPKDENKTELKGENK